MGPAFAGVAGAVAAGLPGKVGFALAFNPAYAVVLGVAVGPGAVEAFGGFAGAAAQFVETLAAFATTGAAGTAVELGARWAFAAGAIGQGVDAVGAGAVALEILDAKWCVGGFAGDIVVVINPGAGFGGGAVVVAANNLADCFAGCNGIAKLLFGCFNIAAMAVVDGFAESGLHGAATINNGGGCGFNFVTKAVVAVGDGMFERGAGLNGFVLQQAFEVAAGDIGEAGGSGVG